MKKEKFIDFIESLAEPKFISYEYMKAVEDCREAFISCFYSFVLEKGESYCGCHPFRDMDEFDEFFGNMCPSDLVRLVPRKNDFNIHDDYFYIDENENLRSCSTYEAVKMIVARADLSDFWKFSKERPDLFEGFYDSYTDLENVIVD